MEEGRAVSIRVMTEFFGLKFGSANRKSVAVRLADHADDSGRGIWPAVSRIAEDCELSVRTVQRVLEEFVAEGMLVVVRKGGSGPGATTRYDFDMARVRTRTGEIAAQGDKGDSMSPFEKGDNCAPKGDSHDEKGCHGDAQTVIEPSEPSKGAHARVRGADIDRNAEKQFWRIVKTWPGFDGMPKEAAKPHFLALDQASRDAAERKQPGWLALLKAQGKDHVPAPSTYFRERLFDVVDDPLDGPKPPVEARPFGKLWGAVRMRRLVTQRPLPAPPPPRAQAELLAEDSDRGRQARLDRQAAHGWPAVNFMHEQAANRRGISVAAGDEWLGELCEAVQAGAAFRAAWKDEHSRRGWPWPGEFDRVEWVYFPAGGPDGLAAFEAKVRGHDGDRQEAAE
jgi:hypothetical protein